MSSQEFKNLGNQAFKDKKFSEAVQFYTQAIELAPTDHVLYSNRSGAYASLSQFQEAEEDADKCIEHNKSFAKGYQRKGHAQYFLGQYSESIESYEEGLKYEPNNQLLKDGLKAAEEKMQEQFSSSSNPFASTGSNNNPFGNLFQGGNPFQGGNNPVNMFQDNPNLQKLHSILQNDARSKAFANDTSFLQLLGILMQNPKIASQYMQSDPRLSIALQVIIEHPEGQKIFFSEFSNKMGGMNEEQQKPQQQEQTQQQQPQQPQQTQPQQPQQPQQQSEPKVEQKQQQQQQQQKKPEPQTSKARNWEEENAAEKAKNLGNELYKQKQFSQALEQYEFAIKINPKEPLYYNNKAACYIETKQYDHAVEACDKGLECIVENVIKDYSKKAKLLARKAKVLYLQGLIDESIDLYQKSLLEDGNSTVKDQMKAIIKEKKDKAEKAYINPEIAEEHNKKGGELFKDGKFPDALKEYDEAIKRQPKEAKYYCNKATCLMRLMAFNEALVDLNKCLDIDVNYIKAYAKKASCHTALKEYQKSKDTYEKGLKKDPQNTELKTGLEKVQMLIFSGSGESEADQQQRAKRGMQDPEIQQILREPEVINLLQDMQTNPQNSMQALAKNKDLAAKIEKLIAAGVLKVG